MLPEEIAIFALPKGLPDLSYAIVMRLSGEERSALSGPFFCVWILNDI